MNKPLEIERKFLIDRPDEGLLAGKQDATFYDIRQTYLLSEKADEGKRIREKIYPTGEHSYIETVKRRVSDRIAEEYERELSREEYEEMLLFRDRTRKTVEKRRYVIPHGIHKLEIDLYPFWKSIAVLEIELSSEDEEIDIPSFLTVLLEVSDISAFKNRALALHTPSEEEVRAFCRQSRQTS